MKKAVGTVPLEPLAFVNYTHADQSFAVATTCGDGTRAYELESGLYELEKSSTTMVAATHKNDEGIIYNDDAVIYVGYAVAAYLMFHALTSVTGRTPRLTS
jgi:hypothetical protein